MLGTIQKDCGLSLKSGVAVKVFKILCFDFKKSCSFGFEIKILTLTKILTDFFLTFLLIN
jgi:hypothetical protein